MHALSQEYQGLESVHPAPTFKKHTFLSPSQELIDAFRPTLPHLQTIYSRELAISTCREIGKPLDIVTWRFDKEELAVLKVMFNKDRETGPRLTIQDCLTAHILTLLNRCLDKPIKRVTSVASYRALDAPFNHPNVAGNQYYMVRMFYSAPISAGTSTANIAGIIRDSIIKHRDLDYVANWLAVCGHLMLVAQSAGQTYFFAGEEDALLVNSMAYIDWTSVHFGFPHSARFFRPSPPPYRRNHLMIFPANPVCGEDGKWVCGDGALDVMLTVPKSCKGQVVDILREGISSVISREP
ncbi:hypothetical protein K503DRAFT_691726 [Rhizopogon vinicolor AM-OR11-026]|uniref:Uncharacterized protein n=1 Tax=Rhizopogon vinicolor AM-OR11-026 TaxID=1314800 RepID=A0A1B7N0H9_9AGAM|nr:hypothetical protein K503DRAFT_691726 [Rhizopogon vinicolor AM-OR11-026]